MGQVACKLIHFGAFIQVKAPETLGVHNLSMVAELALEYRRIAADDNRKQTIVVLTPAIGNVV